MPDRSRRRAAPARIHGRRRAAQVAIRLGTAARSARLAAGLTQADVARRAGVSQGWLSEAERGLAADASLETWSSVGAALNLQLAAFFELAPGATPPRDVQHLRRQQVVIRTSAGGAWAGRPEMPIVTADGANRSIDVFLDRVVGPAHEIVVVEIVDLFTDMGEDLRGLDRKVDAVRATNLGAKVRGLLVVRATARNRALVSEFAALLAARFPGGGIEWLRCLTDPGRPLPDGDGLLWSAVRDGRLSAPRLRRPG
jgi:transcriptional regulator with XRE-family HTH domain